MTDAIIDPPERPTLTDGRVLLRPPAQGDLDAVYAAVEESREEVGRWMGWCHPEYAIADTRTWLAACERHWTKAASSRGSRARGWSTAGSTWTRRCTRCFPATREGRDSGRSCGPKPPMAPRC